MANDYKSCFNINRDVESEASYIARVCSSKDIIGTWADVAKIINENLGNSYTESAYRKQFQSYNKIAGVMQPLEQQNARHLDEVNAKIRELQKERIKLQTEKLEYNKWLREEARDEMILDKIVDEIRGLNALSPLEISNGNMPDRRVDVKEALLCFGDAHYGTEFVIRGLKGEVLNEYSPEICEKRLLNLVSEVKRIIEKEQLTKIIIMDLGDDIDGLLRVSQLSKLKYGVVESSIRYANFLASCLNELCKQVCVDFHMCYGNHSELRMLGQPKGTFEKENMGMVIREIVKTRLEFNTRFRMIENPTGLIFTNIAGYNILGLHGEIKNLSQALKDCSVTYGVSLDYAIGGHKHHYIEETTGVNKSVITVPSIVGVDDFAMSLHRTSEAGAIMLFFERNKGVTLEYKIKL